MERTKGYWKRLSLYIASTVAAKFLAALAKKEPTLVRDIRQPKLCRVQAFVPRPYHNPACRVIAFSPEQSCLQPDRVCSPDFGGCAPRGRCEYRESDVEYKF